MPARQSTFKLVPETLVNKTAPRPPMTSKEAKKAYRERTRLPRISKAEQRRMEAEELARQRKEYEKEKAAARAKATRERKLKKEAEEKEKRKRLGLPEPSIYVRSSQPSIKKFVESGVGRKRSWEELDGVAEEEPESETEEHGTHMSDAKIEPPAKRAIQEHLDHDDDFGDFPSLSQVNFPELFVNSEKSQKQLERRSTSCAVSHESPPSSRPRSAILTSKPRQPRPLSHVRPLDNARPHADVVESPSLTKTTLIGAQAPSMCQKGPAAVSPKAASGPHPRLPGKSTTASPSTVTRPSISESTASQSLHDEAGKLLEDKRSRAMLPPPVPKANKQVPSRNSSSEVSRTMLPPPVPKANNRVPSRSPLSEALKNKTPTLSQKVEAVTSTSRVTAQSVHRICRDDLLIPPPSTLAFLEAHLDDVFPSPSQQVRELLEDVDDIPSNTQIAREIDMDQAEISMGTSLTSASTPRLQASVEDEALHFLSSQDLEISSQDLRDMDTPHKGAFNVPPPHPKAPRRKVRFFEEKEDDLLHAALHESLLLSKHAPKLVASSSRWSSQRLPLQPLPPSHKLNHAAANTNDNDDYGSDGSDLDRDLLALLRRAECRTDDAPPAATVDHRPGRFYSDDNDDDPGFRQQRRRLSQVRWL